MSESPFLNTGNFGIFEGEVLASVCCRNTEKGIAHKVRQFNVLRGIDILNWIVGTRNMFSAEFKMGCSGV